MKKILLIACLLLVGASSWAQAKWDAWNEFAKTKFEPKYDEKLEEYIFYPSFTDGLLGMVGKEITVQGFYVPFAPEDGNYIILSKFPMSQCFFCGGGGPESIAEVNFAKGALKFQVDDLITVKGKLKLNKDNVEHGNFILTEAILISR